MLRIMQWGLRHVDRCGKRLNGSESWMGELYNKIPRNLDHFSALATQPGMTPSVNFPVPPDNGDSLRGGNGRRQQL